MLADGTGADDAVWSDLGSSFGFGLFDFAVGEKELVPGFDVQFRIELEREGGNREPVSYVWDATDEDISITILSNVKESEPMINPRPKFQHCPIRTHIRPFFPIIKFLDRIPIGPHNPQ